MIGDSEMQISLAKPPTENKQKEKRKQMHKMQFVRGSVDFSCLHVICTQRTIKNVTFYF